jgi:hypothetical protein
MNMPLGYDPDELVLTKKQILECMDTVEKVWIDGGRRRNAKYIAGVKLFKIAVKSQNEDVIQSIFKLTMKFLDLLRYHNMLHNQSVESNILKQVNSVKMNDTKSIAKEIFG